MNINYGCYWYTHKTTHLCMSVVTIEWCGNAAQVSLVRNTQTMKAQSPVRLRDVNLSMH